MAHYIFSVDVSFTGPLIYLMLCALPSCSSHSPSISFSHTLYFACLFVFLRPNLGIPPHHCLAVTLSGRGGLFNSYKVPLLSMPASVHSQVSGMLGGCLTLLLYPSRLSALLLHYRKIMHPATVRPSNVEALGHL